MTQWEIWTWDFVDPDGKRAGPHPAVIVSHEDRVAQKQIVNVLYCSSQRASRPPHENEIILDEADGLDWETLCRCDVLYLVDKCWLKNRRGSVIPARRPQIVRRMIESCGWPLY